MLLGALIHAGFNQNYLLSELDSLNLQGLQFQVTNKNINGINAVKVDISSSQNQQLRTLPDILEILDKSNLDKEVLEKTSHIFHALGRAEAKVHNIDIDKVHFHEVGALDTIVDIVGTVVGLRSLGVSKVLCSPLPAGHGFIKCAHGLIPNPAPATCELLKDVPVYGVDLKQELVTPTGAALVSCLADSFGMLPSLSILQTGYGAGTHILPNGQPNLLRLLLGKKLEVAEAQTIEVIETNLDDWSPEGFPYLFDLLFAAGALDVNLTAIQMKKGRPGFTLQVLSSSATAYDLKQIILSETSAIGLRYRTEYRQTLKRQEVSVRTKWGEITAKEVSTPAGKIIHPEFEECRKVAAKHQIPLHVVYNEIRKSS